jgi:alcohol dehydrogenase, propanol-preferring
MKAMVIARVGEMVVGRAPLDPVEMPKPEPGDHELLIQVTACGVCHTELDEIEGRTPPTRLPVVPGHQVIGRVAAVGSRADRFSKGARVGVAWIFSACGRCEHCRSGLENLCPEFRATGRDAHGGYAEFMIAHQDFAYPIPAALDDTAAAPLLCAGAIGYRSLALTGLMNGQRLGLTGFGASAHLVLKMMQSAYPDSRVYVFARSPGERRFAMELGAVWAGDTTDTPPDALHCVIDTTPAWTPVVAALKCLAPGGRVVINAIRKESADRRALLDLDYAAHLWQEKEIKSVANVTRQDVSAFLDLAARIPIIPEVETYDLLDANKALTELKQRRIRGAKVLTIAHP